MPEYSSVDTEVIVTVESTGKRKRGTSSDVATALRDSKIPIQIVPFAVPYYKNRPQKLAGLDWAEAILYQHGLKMADWYNIPQLIDTFGLKIHLSVEEVREQLLKFATQLGYEGWVLKEYQYNGWYKVKHAKTVDCIIVGVNPGKGKFKDMVGSLKVALLLKNNARVEVASVSGMTDTQRRTLTQMWEKRSLLSRVVEVKYQELGSQKRLRHPRFSRMRPDKPLKECTYDQLENNC
jgi:hypothetical protein